MRVQESHECCGHRMLSELDTVDPKTGRIRVSYSHATRTLSESIDFVRSAGFSWIQGKGQYRNAQRLKKEFEKIGFEVTEISLGRNPNTGASLRMYVATKNKKKTVAKKTTSTRLRPRSVSK